MLRLTDIIFESEASKEAKRLGLTYMQFGRWGKDGTVTHDTQKGKLVPVAKQPPEIAAQRRGVTPRPTPEKQREKNLPEPARTSSRLKNIMGRIHKGKTPPKPPKPDTASTWADTRKWAWENTI